MKYLILVLVMSISAKTMAQQTTIKTAWLEKWENSKEYLIGIAEAMPEEYYNFEPTERQMTFKEQLLHIKGNMDWLSNSYFTDKDFDRSITAQPKTKEETIQELKKAFESAYAIIEQTPVEEDRKSVV